MHIKSSIRAESVASSPALQALLSFELGVGLAGWAIIMASWVRAKARHARQSEAGRD